MFFFFRKKNYEEKNNFFLDLDVLKKNIFQTDKKIIQTFLAQTEK